jgi:hypothetical protein
MDATVSSRPGREPSSSLAARWPVATFVVIVLALCGLVFAARLAREVTPFALVIVIPIAAIVSAWLVGGRIEVRGLVGRITRWRVPARWYVIGIGIPLVATLTIDVVGILTGAATPGAVIGAIGPSALIVPLVVLLPSLFEEFAWRGYGVERAVQGGADFPRAALGIGLVFMAIHVPLYLPGQLYDNLPLWPSVLTLLGYAVLLSWIYLGSGHSSLLAGISHGALNGFVPLTSGLDAVWVWEARGIIFALLGLAILLLVSRRPTGRSGA